MTCEHGRVAECWACERIRREALEAECSRRQLRITELEVEVERLRGLVLRCWEANIDDKGHKSARWIAKETGRICKAMGCESVDEARAALTGEGE